MMSLQLRTETREFKHKWPMSPLDWVVRKSLSENVTFELKTE